MNIQSMLDRRGRLDSRRMEILDKIVAEKRDDYTPDEEAELKQLKESVDEINDELQRSGYQAEGAAAIRRAGLRGGSGGWAERAATALHRLGGEARAIASGSVDVPTLVETEVAEMERPTRLLDLLINRKALQSNAFEYLRQTVRTNNAEPVPDGGIKPLSYFTTEAVEDRARVVAHLSEPFPIRYFADHEELLNWLDTEMAEGVLDALEAQLIAGDGQGEAMTGLLSTAGTTAVPYSADLPTTLRSAVTALQIAGVQPNGWVMHPNDAQAIDLLRFQWGGAEAADAGFLLDGYQNSNAGSGNVFGPTTPRVVSTSVPEGTAVLGDWNQLRLYVREDVRLDVDAGGPLFTTNEAVVRAEGRFGVGVLRPSSFAIVDLVA